MLPAMASATALTSHAYNTTSLTRLVQKPIGSILKGNCSTPTDTTLQSVTMRNLQADFAAKSHRPSDDQMDALRDVVATAVAMAEGSCVPATYLSSLDPGVGKTTAIVNFIQQLLLHPDHQRVSILVCLPRRDEISRVVNDMNLPPEDFAVMTSDEATNRLSTTPPEEARILLTTHSMIEKHCRVSVVI